MIPDIPWSITVISVATNVAIVIAVTAIVASAGARSGLAPQARRAVRLGTGIFLAAWLGLAWLLAPRGVPGRACGLALMAPAFYVMPPAPAFYLKPQSVADIVDQIARRVIDVLNLFEPLAAQWRGDG